MKGQMFWDIILYNLPWRYHLSECINNGELPLWNPYMNYGFPQMGHYETWYPVSWIIALLYKYDLIVLQFEYLFNLLMAGVGFYQFTKLFQLHKQTRTIGAIAYMLCGVFISQASQLGYLTSGAWMPFVFYFLIRFLQKPSFEIGLYFTFFYYLLVTGGYAGNFITITYICIAIVVYFVIKYFRQKAFSTLKQIGGFTLILSVLFIGMYSVVLYSTSALNPLITRSSLDYNNEGFGAQTGSSSLIGYSSLISPSSTSVSSELWNTSKMLNDAYIGLIPLLLSIFFLLFGRKSSYYKLAIWLFGIAILFLMISAAVELPFHNLLYRLLPLMDQFRFPSLFRIFFIFNLITISLFSIELILQNAKTRIVFGKYLGIVLILMTIGLFFTSPVNLPFINEEFFTQIKQQSISNMWSVDLLIGISLLSILLLFTVYKPKHLLLTLLILTAGDMIIHTWIRTPTFVHSDKNPQLVNQQIKAIHQGFPLINQQITTGKITETFEKVPKLWLNRFTYFKYPIVEGSSPYSTKTYSAVIQNHLLDTALQYPFIAVFDELEDLSNSKQHYNITLTKNIQSTYTSPNQFDFTISQAEGKTILFNHNTHPDWHFYENGEHLISKSISGNFLAVQLKSDESALSIKFEPKTTIRLFYLSLFSFLICIGFILYFQIKNITNISHQNKV
ncbi:hypothetical protein DNU06_02350 [Putridiphycobacter roseus]|uniref:YfhO family protein n=2 Tax=Putridiphycobacter roseus TaxID=2219161 RepID=A0A2W1N512_9FLAO|nr:hypothetical protein DNU06_02350 [Putridiphycobacter roseus]